MEYEHFKLAAKVLFFGTLEESYAIEKAQEIALSKTRLQALEGVLEALEKRKTKKITSVLFDKGAFKFPVGVDISFWREFRYHAKPENFRAVLLKWIGGLEDQEICALLKITQGSLDMRFNEGLKHLGGFLIKERVAMA